MTTNEKRKLILKQLGELPKKIAPNIVVTSVGRKWIYLSNADNTNDDYYMPIDVFYDYFSDEVFGER